MDKNRAHELFLVGLRNAHALENQALSMMQPQINRLENYPDVRERLTAHQRETEQQVARLDRIMESVGESPSSLKDTALSLMGALGALGHSTSGDEILKNTFANYAFENYEIASYKSLIALADAAGHAHFIEALEQTLGEEIAMASWIDDQVEAVTLRFLDLAASGQQAKV